MISTVDREARHTRKSKSKRRDGFRGHVAAEPETGLITDCEMTMAAGEGSTDAENGVKMAGRDRFRGARRGRTPASPAGDTADTGRGDAGRAARRRRPAGPAPAAGTGAACAGAAEAGPRARDQAQQAAATRAGLEVYGDSAYGSGEARAAYRDAGHDTVIKPGPLRPAVPGGFTLDDFTVDEEQGTVTCPAGQIRQMSKSRAVTFGAACAALPAAGAVHHRQRRPVDDASTRTMGLLRAARAQARTAEFRQAYPTRSAIERIISWTATQNGRRVRLRYIGTAKNDAWLHTRCAAINLRTLLRHGLTRQDGAWVLA